MSADAGEKYDYRKFDEQMPQALLHEGFRHPRPVCRAPARTHLHISDEQRGPVLSSGGVVGGSGDYKKFTGRCLKLSVHEDSAKRAKVIERKDGYRKFHE